MQKLFGTAPDVPQTVANKGARLIEGYLRRNRVSRAKELPDEERVRLLRDLRALFDAELGPVARNSDIWATRRRRSPVQRFLEWLTDSLEDLVARVAA